MRSIRLLLAVIVSIVSVTLSARSIERPSDQAIASFIDGYLSRQVAERDIPGAAIVLVRDGRPVFARGYGVADYDTGRPVSVEDTVLRQASTAKLFVWVLVMQLVEEGRLDLDAGLDRYLDFRLPDTFRAPITMRQLMTHSAGFEERMTMVSEETLHAPLGIQVRENVPDRVYAPGSTVAYSNYGAALAAYVVERLRGMPFERVLEERVFRPLKMTRSTIAQPVPPALRPLLASHYSASSRTPAPFDFVGLAPAGAATVSPGDMGRFTAMLMNGGLDETGGRVLRAETLAAMMQLQQPLVRGIEAGLGYGFIVGEYRGVRHAGHGGSMSAGTTDLEILPELGLGWYLGFNGRGENGSALPLRQQLLRAVIDRFVASAAAAHPVTPHATDAKSIAGTYLPTRRLHAGIMQLFAALDPLVVKLDGEALTIELESGPTRWLPSGPDRFAEQHTRLPLAVARDASGRVTRLASPLLNGVSQYEPAPLSVRLLPVLLLAPAVLMLTAITASLRWIVRRVVRRTRQPETALGAQPASRAATASFRYVVLTIAGWLAYLLVQLIAPGALSVDGVPVRILKLLSMATVIAAAILLAHALRAWRDESHARRVAAGRTVTACASVALVWLYFVLDCAAF